MISNTNPYCCLRNVLNLTLHFWLKIKELKKHFGWLNVLKDSDDEDLYCSDILQIKNDEIVPDRHLIINYHRKGTKSPWRFHTPLIVCLPVCHL